MQQKVQIINLLVERFNLRDEAACRVGGIRFTNAFSKKIENHCYAIVLHFVYYNFVKNACPLIVTPAP